MDTDIIVTAAPAYEPLAALRGQERFPKGAQLLLLHAGKAEPLVEGFAATADANVGFDGKTVLFAGKRAAGDPWQIWELTLKDRSVRKADHDREPMRFVPSIFHLGAWFLRCAHSRGFNWRPRKGSTGVGPGRRLFNSPTCRPARCPRMCWRMGASCLKPAFRWVPDPISDAGVVPGLLRRKRR
jgi:hypothetical protein